MKRFIAAGLGCLFISISGCATNQHSSPEDAAVAKAPLYCSGTAECAQMWRRAQLWVAKRSNYRIQSATDVVISTYGPTANSAYFAYQITREERDAGREQILIDARCANMFGCGDLMAQVADFKRYLRGGV